MELIDRNSLKDAECDECAFCATDSNFKRDVEKCRAEGCEIMDRIDRQPVIDAVPVVHAKWVGNNGTFCSNCGKSDANAYNHHIPYCWNCGAKMDGDE